MLSRPLPSVSDSMDFGAPLIVIMNFVRSAGPSVRRISISPPPSTDIMWVHRGVVSPCCHREAFRYPSIPFPSLSGIDVLGRGHISSV